MDLSILIVDDENSFRSAIVELLIDAGFVARGAESGEAALLLLDQGRYDIIFTDLRMPGIDGLTLLDKIKKIDAAIEVVMVTSHTSVSSAIEALRLGAYDYLIKPLDDIGQVLAIIKRIAEKLSLAAEKKRLSKELRDRNQELAESNLKVIQYSEDITGLYAAEKELLAGLDLIEVYQRSIACLSKLVSLRPALLWTLSESGRDLLLEAQSGLDSLTLPRLTVRFSGPMTPATAIIPLPFKTALLSKTSSESVLFHPIIGRQRLFGFLAILDQKKEAFSIREKEILARFSSSVAVAIENARLYEKVKAMAIRDGLTGLYNRRHFEEALTAEIIRSLRHNHPISLLFLDVDHFKSYNDSQGHQMGDQLLKELADLLLKRVRVTDIVCRYGGEEFTIILPETDKANARIVAENIRAKVEEHPFPHREQQIGGAVTVSIGISECPSDGRDQTEIIKRADDALYRAKGAGRNRVCD